MRDVFRKAGYSVYLVDEFRTSKCCYNCGENLEKFVERRNPRPWKRDQTIMVHGLLRCTSCKCLWNRDVNASLNIRRVVEEHIKGNGRPVYLRRDNSLSASSLGAYNIVPEEQVQVHVPQILNKTIKRRKVASSRV